MATIRRRILEAVAAKLETATGWVVRVRRIVEDLEPPKVAVVYSSTETKEQRSGGCGEWTCNLSIDVAIDVDAAAVDPELDPYEVLDDAIAELEAVLPADGDPAAAYGIASLDDLRLVRTRMTAPTDEIGPVTAVLSLEAQYRHDAQNPSTWGGQP